MKTYATLDNIEIFRAGTWNNDTYSIEDLDGMVSNFNALRHKRDVPLKLGHDENQKLLQKDGMPSAGWVSSIKRVGDKIVASAIDVPQKIFDLVVSGAYRKVSAEIYPSYKDAEGTKYSKVLRAIALLGSDIPAVEGLSSIQAMYAAGQLYKVYSLDYCQSSKGLKFEVRAGKDGRLIKVPGKYEIDPKSYTPSKQREYDDKLHATMKQYSLTPVEAVVRIALEDN